MKKQKKSEKKQISNMMTMMIMNKGVDIMKKFENEISNIVKNWYGKRDDLYSISLPNLANALDQAQLDTARGLLDPRIPFVIAKTFNEKMLKTIETLKNLKKEGKIEACYMLIRPKQASNINRIFVITKKSNEYNLGIDYDPESQKWNFGHYGATSAEDWVDYIREEYGIPMPLI